MSPFPLAISIASWQHESMITPFILSRSSIVKLRLACIVALFLPSAPAFADDFERGLVALNQKNNDLAIAYFNAHIRLEPKHALAYCNRGIAYSNKKDYDKAIADFTQAVRFDPNLADAFYCRGNLLSEKKEYDKAIADYSNAVNIDPMYAVAYFNRGNAHTEKKEHDKAITDYSRVIHLNPKDFEAYTNRGNAYTDKKEYDKAIADYTQAIRLEPKDAVAHNNRGYAYFCKKEYEKASVDYSQAIRLEPMYAKACANLGWLLSTCPNDALRNGQKAIELATKAGELSHWKVAQNHEVLAAANAETGNFMEAVKWQKLALEVGFANEAEKEAARQRLKLYEEGKRYRVDNR